MELHNASRSHLNCMAPQQLQIKSCTSLSISFSSASASASATSASASAAATAPPPAFFLRVRSSSTTSTSTSTSLVHVRLPSLPAARLRSAYFCSSYVLPRKEEDDAACSFSPSPSDESTEPSEFQLPTAGLWLAAAREVKQPEEEEDERNSSEEEEEEQYKHGDKMQDDSTDDNDNNNNCHVRLEEEDDWAMEFDRISSFYLST
eukprot:2591828-Rhodomonas_salina.2